MPMGTSLRSFTFAETRELLRVRRLLFAGVLLLAITSVPTAQVVGDAFPKWTPGTLDIHQINTGRGNAAFLMLPDGTTMMVDAGNGGNLPPRGTPPKPEASRTPGEWIARYMRAMGASAIDYGYLTHFHDDHMNAIVDVAGRFPVARMLDRAWPDYNYPSVDHREFQSAAFLQYREWLKKGATKGERLVPGRGEQIVLTREPSKYPDFHVRNIAANGEVWTGIATGTRRHFPPLDGLAPPSGPPRTCAARRFAFLTEGSTTTPAATCPARRARAIRPGRMSRRRSRWRLVPSKRPSSTITATATPRTHSSSPRCARACG